MFDRKRRLTRAELRLAIVTRIERTYHRRRRQRTLRKPTPVELNCSTPPVATAAIPPSQLNRGSLVSLPSAAASLVVTQFAFLAVMQHACSRS